MTVAELIATLQGFPPSTRVMVNGYEGGYSDLGRPVTKAVALNVNTEWYYGRHDDPWAHPTAEVIQAVIIRS